MKGSDSDKPAEVLESVDDTLSTMSAEDLRTRWHRAMRRIIQLRQTMFECQVALADANRDYFDRRTKVEGELNGDQMYKVVERANGGILPNLMVPAFIEAYVREAAKPEADACDRADNRLRRAERDYDLARAEASKVEFELQLRMVRALEDDRD